VRKIHAIQHVPFETPAHIGRWAEKRGLALETVRLFDGAPPPDAGGVEALVLMGGPMSVHDEAAFPWLVEEKRLVEHVLRAEKPVLGVCLGAQIIADVLGARVHKNRFQEIGWYRVEPTAEGRAHTHFAFAEAFTPLHWHGETFELPTGAVHLARSAACEQQVFAWGGRVLGMQFHLEMTPESIEDLIANCSGEMGSGPYVQFPEQITAVGGNITAAHALLEMLLDRWKEDRHEDPA